MAMAMAMAMAMTMTRGVSSRSSCVRARASGSCDEVKSERGVRFVVGEGFFREESREGRDLGVLAAGVYRRRTGRLRVMDAMCGCGVRALRYLAQANADFVWANDGNEDASSTILCNLSQHHSSKWLISHGDANRLMSQRYLLHDYYDLIDVDSFGSASSFFASAFSAIRHGGLIYLTSTDGFSSGGHRPHNALTSYGAFIRPMPYANEIGLRMLIGGAVREAATRNMDATPVFSLFSYHGPVFRVMLQVAHGNPQKNRHYGFISYCKLCGNSQAFSWENMGQFFCPCSERKVKSRSLIVSGPLWTGPLHSRIKIHEMLELAEEWGWTTNEECSSGGKNANLKKLLSIMFEESTPELPFGYIKLDEIARRGKINSPRRDGIIDILKKEFTRIGVGQFMALSKRFVVGPCPQHHLISPNIIILWKCRYRIERGLHQGSNLAQGLEDSRIRVAPARYTKCLESPTRDFTYNHLSKSATSQRGD